MVLLRDGYAGMPYDISPKNDVTYFNSADEVAQVNTLTITAVVAGGKLSVTIDGTQVQLTASDTDTVATFRDKLIERLNITPLNIYAVETATAGQLTLTGIPGVPFTIQTNVSGGVTVTNVATTAVSSSAFIPLGVAVVRDTTDNWNQCRLGSADPNHIFLGFTFDPQYLVTNICMSPAKTGFNRQDPVNVRQMGTLYVRCETDIAPNDPVFYRYGGTGELGHISNVTSAGADKQLLNVQVIKPGNAGGIVPVRLANFAVPATPVA